jgi:Fic family protein
VIFINIVVLQLEVTLKILIILIEEIDSDGVHIVRFKPVAAFETLQYIEILCAEFERTLEQSNIDSLLLIAIFVLDFLCIHPFNDGNGRISRLLTLLLLYREGYIVGKYISLEMIVEQTKETYYDVLYKCSIDWHEGKNVYAPFVEYFLGTILGAYKEFSKRVEHLRTKGITKSERIRNLFNERIEKLSKSEIAKFYPDISVSTIERVLADLLKENYIIKVGVGRNSTYIKNPEKRK